MKTIADIVQKEFGCRTPERECFDTDCPCAFKREATRACQAVMDAARKCRCLESGPVPCPICNDRGIVFNGDSHEP